MVPLKDEQRTLGVLKVVATRPNAFSDRDAKALRLLGGLMGAALGHAAAFEGRQSRLEERTRALQESEQRFKQLVDVAQEGIWVADDRGVITYVNPRMAELLGYQNGAMLGRQVFDFIDAASRAGAQRTLTRPSASSGESRGPALPAARRQRGVGTGVGQPDRGPGRAAWSAPSAWSPTSPSGSGRRSDCAARPSGSAILHDMDQAILAARSPAEIGRAALGRIRRMVPCQRCTVVLFDFPAGQAQLIAG